MKAIHQSTGGANAIGFWTIFALIMGFGLPIFIHLQQEDWQQSYDQSANMAFFFLGLGLVLWVLLIVLFSSNFLFRLIGNRTKLMNLHQSGKQIRAKVMQKLFQNNTKNGELIRIELSFKNFAQAMVNYSLTLYDSKPEERRFDVGKEVTLLVDENAKKQLITLEAGKVAFNKPILRLILFVQLVLIVLPIGLLSYGYLYESQGYGWRYLSFWHPFILCPILGLIYTAVLLFFRKLVDAPANDHQLLLFGKSAEATIQSASETGLSINDQPQIVVQVAFEHQGKTIVASFKKIYSLLDLSKLIPGEKVKIIYDSKNPQHVEPND
ncbi:hypothetical protein ACFRAE_05590 [Sphingobacterium sp. HJSM2_6]|uniref:hypothetical protein n=1 Tax=Sphingobacterium sp. HJSM2_6 TaxID=3366264 RepID=UPI003BDF733C